MKYIPTRQRAAAAEKRTSVDVTQRIRHAAQVLDDLGRVLADAQDNQVEQWLSGLDGEIRASRNDLAQIRAVLQENARESAAVGEELRALRSRIGGLEDEIDQQRSSLSTLLAAGQVGAPPPATTEPAYRALIAAHDQLGIVVAAGGPHADVVAGQRGNIEQLLAQIGIVPLTAASGAPFDYNIMCSDDSMVPTTDEVLADRVAEVAEIGWRFADGSGVVRTPKIRLYQFVPAGPGYSEPAPEPSGYGQGRGGPAPRRISEIPAENGGYPLTFGSLPAGRAESYPAGPPVDEHTVRRHQPEREDQR
ncbi:hypothetical protein [Nocardia thailandica]